MITSLTSHLGDLVETLHDLRRRLRQTARVEVARAIGEALREVTLALICGPVRYPSAARAGYSAWEDPWQDPGADGWDSGRPFPPEGETTVEDRERGLSLPPALVAGLGAARWGFLRTRQIGPAILMGLLVALAACAGGPTVKTLLEAWSATRDLLSFSAPDRMS